MTSNVPEEASVAAGSSRRAFLVIGAVLAIGIGTVVWLNAGGPSDDDLIRRARAALKSGDAGAARDDAAQVLEHDPDSVAALAIWADASWKLGQREAAVERVQEINENSREAARVLSDAGDRALELGWPIVAEDCLARALALDPRDVSARSRLAYLCGVEGRVQEMQAHVFEMIRQGEFTRHHLVMLAAGDAAAADEALVERFRAARPDETLPLLGRARADVYSNRAAEAIPVLRRIVAQHPDIPEVWAQLGLALTDVDPDAIEEWRRDLPDSALEHPDVRVVRGLSASTPEKALVEFAAAVRLDPDHRVANHRLSRALEGLGRSDEAAAFAERSRKLRRLELVVLKAHEGSLDAVREVCGLLEELGRPWEADAWYGLVLAQSDPPPWAVAGRERLQPVLAGDPSRSSGPEVPELAIASTVEPLSADHSPLATSDANFSFVEDARRVGLEFTYQSGVQLDAESVPQFASMGGGVGILDFDRDGRPDVLLPQGNPGPAERGDRLFRNWAGRFEDVTAYAIPVETDYGNGVAAGDVDGDGFPDLYLANLGRNRLLLNNGDGTFRDATTVTGMDAREWTTSAVVADLDGDGLADLYDVDYLDYETAPNMPCIRGRAMDTCGPRGAEPGPDRLWLNLGDGTFRDASREAGIVSPHGKGLGIVVGRLDDEPGLDAFIANDLEPNLLFSNRTREPGAPRFVDEAIAIGVAVDRDGLTQACMGIAAGDATGDGRTDLYVSNFSNESNTLYVPDDIGLFDDATREAGLRSPSFEPLGFGTQFLDVDLDGWQDLAVANGHIFDMTVGGGEFHQRPQIYHNLGSGRFEEVAGSNLGAYFENRFLGRGMARLDWNVDGRPDLVVSNVHDPAVLVTNRTEPVGGWLAVELIATRTARDAIGTRVSISIGDRTIVRELFAGDGYQSSNERRLPFGLPGRPETVAVDVEWPDGRRTRYEDLGTGAVWQVVDDGTSLRLPN